MNDRFIRVEVVYALPERQELLGLEVPLGTTVMEAIDASGIRERFDEIEVDEKRLGIFGRRTTANTVLKEGDRVEIYRPLIADPKEGRRARAAAQKS